MGALVDGCPSGSSLADLLKPACKTLGVGLFAVGLERFSDPVGIATERIGLENVDLNGPVPIVHGAEADLAITELWNGSHFAFAHETKILWIAGPWGLW